MTLVKRGHSLNTGCINLLQGGLGWRVVICVAGHSFGRWVWQREVLAFDGKKERCTYIRKAEANQLLTS